MQNTTGASTKGANPVSRRNRTQNTLSDLTDAANDFVDESYDESQDPDYTISATTIIEYSEDGNEEDDDDYEIIGADETIIDLDELNESTDAEVESVIEENIKSSDSDPSSSTESFVSLPLHKKFHSLIHKHEIPRKLFHVSIGFITLYLYTQGKETSDIWPPLLYAMLAIFSLDLLRFNWKYFNDLYCASVGFLMREKEVQSFNGVIWFLLGVVTTFLTQKKDISVMSVLLLSWSDTAASTIGRSFGHLSPKISKSKSLVGSFGAFLTGVFACYFFYGYVVPSYPQYATNFEYVQGSNKISLHLLALLSGFIAALSEGIDFAGIDDNLTIPVLSGLFLSMAVKFGN